MHRNQLEFGSAVAWIGVSGVRAAVKLARPQATGGHRGQRQKTVYHHNLQEHRKELRRFLADFGSMGGKQLDRLICGRMIDENHLFTLFAERKNEEMSNGTEYSSNTTGKTDCLNRSVRDEEIRKLIAAGFHEVTYSPVAPFPPMTFRTFETLDRAYDPPASRYIVEYRGS